MPAPHTGFRCKINHLLPGSFLVTRDQHIAFDDDIMLQQMRCDVLKRSHDVHLVTQQILRAFAGGAFGWQLHRANFGRYQWHGNVDENLALQLFLHAGEGCELMFGRHREHHDVGGSSCVTVHHRIGLGGGADGAQIGDRLLRFLQRA